ncbi:MAG: 2-aminobenzoate-CoA ligase, partial [Candidatus Eremiobacteraeota bacterium]|nr:2-aminobenzoate-CoA ligase [Candidatus Eremiobacteraeota bacterium]
MSYTAHVDTFARDHLPPKSQWPDHLMLQPEFSYPERLNCASLLLDRHIKEGQGARRCIVSDSLIWTYAELQAQA